MSPTISQWAVVVATIPDDNARFVCCVRRDQIVAVVREKDGPLYVVHTTIPIMRVFTIEESQLEELFGEQESACGVVDVIMMTQEDLKQNG